MKENNLKKSYSVDQSVSNYSFLKGLILERVPKEEIINSKNFKKLNIKNKNKIKKLIKIRSLKGVDGVENFIEEKNKKRRETKKKLRKNKNKCRNYKEKINLDDENQRLNEEIENLKIENEELKNKVNKNIFSYEKNMGEEQQRIFNRNFEIRDKLQKELNNKNKYEKIFKNINDEKVKEDMKEVLTDTDERIKKINLELEESENEISDFQKRAGISEEDDDY
jgi:hypothetical protein